VGGKERASKACATCVVVVLPLLQRPDAHRPSSLRSPRSIHRLRTPQALTHHTAIRPTNRPLVVGTPAIPPDRQIRATCGKAAHQHTRRHRRTTTKGGTKAATHLPTPVLPRRRRTTTHLTTRRTLPTLAATKGTPATSLKGSNNHQRRRVALGAMR
jgi:hypothetical protein